VWPTAVAPRQATRRRARHRGVAIFARMKERFFKWYFARIGQRSGLAPVHRGWGMANIPGCLPLPIR
jgi:hypothetical protein